ncbi:FKBP12-associated protein [Microbotryomycetes sp. JL221]|nr:FKBP12-associated protein [Microbotryomycetes sp. JL221]
MSDVAKTSAKFSVDEPCPKLIQLTCDCGHLQQSTRCGACEARPEGNSTKKLTCGDACVINKRNLALADALGIEKDKREAKIKEVEYDGEMMSFYQANVAFCTQIEASLTDFVRGLKAPFDKPSFHFPVMKRPQRAFTHELAELFGLRSESLDEEPRRSVVVHRQSIAGVPSPTLAEAYAARRKPAAATLSFGSLRKAQERKTHNALYLEGVLGFDESMLKDILRPMMRGLIFAVSWVGDEDVLVTFQHESSPELETKLHSIQASLRTLIEETGFCAIVELATVGEDGRVQKGSWTPVGGGGHHFASVTPAPRSRNSTTTSSRQSVSTSNAFATLTGSSPPSSSNLQSQQVQSLPGSVVGPALYRPPRAVVASVTGHDKQVILTSSVPSARVQNDEDVPDDWDTAGDTDLVDKEPAAAAAANEG